MVRHNTWSTSVIEAEYGLSIADTAHMGYARATRPRDPLAIYLMAIGKAMGLPCGASEARHPWWKDQADMGKWDGTSRLDARPAVEMYQHGLSIGQAVAVYRYAMASGLWDTPYGSPRTVGALLIQQAIIRRWTYKDLVIIARVYGKCRRLPKNAARLAKLYTRIYCGLYRLAKRDDLCVPDSRSHLLFTAAKVLCRRPTQHMYLAILHTLHCMVQGSRESKAEFYSLLKDSLQLNTRELLSLVGSPAAQWAQYGFTGHDGAAFCSICVPSNLSGRGLHDLLDGAPIDNATLVAAIDTVMVFGKLARQWKALWPEKSVHDLGQLFYLGEHCAKAGAYILAHQKDIRQLQGQNKADVAWSDCQAIIAKYNPSMATLSWAEIRAALRKSDYVAAAGLTDPALLQVAMELEMSVRQAQEFKGWLNDHPAKTECHVPAVEVRGEEVGLMGNWRMYQLPIGDYRGPVLGLYTNCCQHPYGAGSTCAEHGHTSPDGAFYVVEYNNRIVAQSWVWLDKELKGLCFDNIEALSDVYQEGIAKLYEEAARRIVATGITVVTVGCGYNDIPALNEFPMVHEYFMLQVDCGLYSDARQCQRELAHV